ncbi:ABC transporter ATP-binding protein [Marivita sp. GX14005]|uniref:ABC transporter ATP-binding protein n=1 Tax=Marivita sp. GX14005 TaxID=2942276 RepID=UPI00201A1D93|nr:ABC transporter ATP-binding protein [Marivita sp. GX14005]MCL3881837.1 ABC transporter ATP-binding protein [Marivita sp. GX14005]
MTGLSTYLEDFGTVVTPGNLPGVNEDTIEAERLESFDKGYRAGWDDAIKAKSEETAQHASEFAQNLQDLSFTYHEVHAQVLSNLVPLFDEILNKMLPAVARDTLGAHICDQLSRISRDIGTASIEIAVAPGAGEQVIQMVNDTAGTLPISVVEMSDIADGQAELRLGQREISIDLADTIRQIADAVHEVIHEKPKVQSHG